MLHQAAMRTHCAPLLILDAAALAETERHALAKPNPTRQQIESLERHLFQLPQVDVPVVHRFAPGLYMREIRIPADTLMTGRVHRFEHVSIMVQGDMTLLTDEGMQRVTGYQPFIAPAGTKRVGYAHAETVWVTVHRNPDEIRDPEALVDLLTEPLLIGGMQ